MNDRIDTATPVSTVTVTPAGKMLRGADIAELITDLKEAHARKLDVVVDTRTVEAAGAKLHVETDQGTIAIAPERTMVDTMSARLKLPAQLMRELNEKGNAVPATDDLDEAMAALTVATDYAEAFDKLVNARIRHEAPGSVMLRTYTPAEPGTSHVGRAWLSNRFRIVDNLEVLLTVLQGVQAAGMDGIEVSGADLGPSRMRVRFVAPAVSYVATELAKGYRSPFMRGNDHPDVVWAGFEVSNGELGDGTFGVTPRAELLICRNGLTRSADIVSTRHLGGKLEVGQVEWADDTQRANLDTIRLKARDAIAQFLSFDYLESLVAELDAKAAAPIVEPVKALQVVSKDLGMTDDEAALLLDRFMGTGQTNRAAGVFNAVTELAQLTPDADRAAFLEANATRVMELAAAH